MFYITKAIEITLVVVGLAKFCELANETSFRKSGLDLDDDEFENNQEVADLISEESHERKHESDPDLQMILEEKYRFRNDETTTRFRIAKEEGEQPDTNNAQNKAWFRTFAARRIVGGMETSINVYPYTVAIARNGKHWCGGAVVDEQWVFTAGHCLEAAIDGDKKKLQNYIVRAGSSFHNRGGYQARVNKAFFPTSYAPGNADFDFCLLRLDRPMPIGRNIAVLNLPSKGFALMTDDILIVTGWGSTHESGYGHIPDRIRFVPVPVMSLEKCQKSYRFYITRRMLCAGYATGGKDACNHDSGGPAVRDGVLLGIVSFGGKQCGDPRSPGVYSRVSEITDWVDNTITDNEAFEVPELKAKIEKARKREKELKKFKTRIEDKKNKIKNWLRNTLKSTNFIELAKRKLIDAGFITGDTRRLNKLPNLDENDMDDANLFNMINERILEVDGIDDEAEYILRTLALQEIVSGHSREELYSKLNENEENFESVMAYLTK